MITRNEAKRHETQKKAFYTKPELISRGDVLSLTQGGFTTGGDAQQTGEAGAGGTS